MGAAIEQAVNGAVPSASQIGKLYRDSSMDDGTLGLIDFSGLWGRPQGIVAGGTVPGGSLFNNYTRAADTADIPTTTFAPLVWDGQGLVLSQATWWQGVRLPAAFFLGSASRHVLLTFWVKLQATGVTNVSGKIATCSRINSIPNWEFYPSGSGGIMTQCQFNLCNVILLVFTQNQCSYFCDGNFHQLAVEVVITGTGQAKATSYLDGQILLDSGYHTIPALSALPAPPGDQGAYLGPATGYGNYAWPGTYYRARIDDLTATPRTAMQILAADLAVAKQLGLSQ